MPQSESAELPVECCGVVCDERSLSEIDSGRVMVTVDRKDIRQIALKCGLVSAHPILQFGVGLVFAALAYLPLVHLLHWIRYGGTFWVPTVFVVPVAVVGLSLVLTAFRRGRYLEVDSAQGRKRLTFRNPSDLPALDRFIASMEHRYGLRVERDEIRRTE